MRRMQMMYRMRIPAKNSRVTDLSELPEIRVLPVTLRTDKTLLNVVNNKVREHTIEHYIEKKAHLFSQELGDCQQKNSKLLKKNSSSCFKWAYVDHPRAIGQVHSTL
ncbi:hypothetical protein JTE90_024179 [Oedothorax gibbosus]|uniref:Vitellogenin n=1 Tax=Oedothorax gibbosus TaxID=931172 RepID=A0AAV6UF14_9ARAC|nr:hypothetical protein JTE90_024179 [Oedothorax gibbosus]